MTWYQALSIIILAVGLFIMLILVTNLYRMLPKAIRGSFVAIKQTFCCNILGCKGGLQLNPLCIMCGGCTCAHCE